MTIGSLETKRLPHLRWNSLELIDQVDAMVRESGVTEGFNPSQWVAAWLQRPHPALNGKRPAELMDTGEGRELVAELLAKQPSSAYT